MGGYRNVEGRKVVDEWVGGGKQTEARCIHSMTSF